jgi:hypothetical protein
MSLRQLRWGFVALVVLIGGMVALVVFGVAGRSWEPVSAHTAHGVAPASEVIGAPTRWTGPQGRVGQFVVRCDYSHSATDDPIVGPGEPGRSHRHDFFGATSTDAASTAKGLFDDDTTCDKRGDTAAYWQPTLYDHGEPVVPVGLDAYYRAAPGVDPTTVQSYPFGLEMVAGDMFAEGAPGDESAGWVCGSSTDLQVSAPECPASAPLHMVLTFPDCWNGEQVRSDGHRAHVAYSTGGACPPSHPVVLPQLMVSVAFPIWGLGHDLTLASGSTNSAHGDFLNAWDPAALEREVANCINRAVVCDLASNRAEEPLFRHD